MFWNQNGTIFAFPSKMFVLFSLASARMTVLSAEEKSFMSWMRNTNRMYVGDEYQFRLGLWLAADRRIKEHNKGESSFMMGHNDFSAMTRSEYESMLGYRMTSEAETEDIVESNYDAPDALDYRDNGWVNQIKNQADCGSCWAFSSVQGIETNWAKATGTLLSLSESNLVDCCSSCNGCNGGMMDTTYKWVIANQAGKFMLERDYPYVAVQRSCVFDPEKAVANVASYVKVTLFSESDLKKKIAEYGAADLAIYASLSSFQSYKSGIYYDILCEGIYLNHAVGCIGYGTQDGTDFWIVRNSWGTGWGEAGYIRIKRNALNQCGVASKAIIPLVQ